MSFWYLASPYSKYAKGPEAAYVDACDAAARLMARGMTIFCPIAHGHSIANFLAVDRLDGTYWLRQCEPFMRLASGLVVVKMDGWEISEGVQHELKHFKAAKKPIMFFDWPIEEKLCLKL